MLSICIQELFTQKVNHTYKQTRSQEFTTKSGFYTDQMMKDELKFSEPLCCNSSCSTALFCYRDGLCM